MDFELVDFFFPTMPRPNHAYLVINSWDDFGFKTLFHLHVYDNHSVEHDIGPVKIAQSGMHSGPVKLPTSFVKLDNTYFSVGQSTQYYAALQKLDRDRGGL
ncbi:MAG: hypothetical protein HQL53_10760 [Magnetococcales bacterium]|nr:hypothetical protein [Magnetococcales bacterium]